MKKLFISALLTASAGLILTGCQSDTTQKTVSHEDLASGFVSPPDSISTAVYWYWVSNNVSKEGVVKDLEAMKKAGITRAYIGNIGQDDVPYGDIVMLTDAWWEILHTALKKAGELNIEIGIFNSPGWSQSGGPWVSEKEAMRYLTSSELRIKGPVALNQKLEKPTEEFHDVKLLAFPAPKNDRLILNNQNARITSIPTVSGLDKLVDGNTQTGINFPEGKDLILDFSANEPFTARNITIRTTETRQNINAELLVKEGDEYRQVKAFRIERFNPDINVGFEPFAPVVETFPAVTSKEFRVVLKNGNPKHGVAEVQLGAGAKVERYAEKILSKMHQTPLPFWHEYQWKQQAVVDDAALLVNPEKVLDISDKLMADGTLRWDVPEGDWVILRTGMTPTGTKNSPAPPEATGYEVDKMSRKHTAMHFDGHMGEILRRIPAEDRKTFKVVVQDSYETGGQNFTDDFIERFKQEYEYDPVPFLPVYNGIVVESQDASDRFLWDMRRLVANMVASEYVGGLRDVSHQHGLTTWLENYGHWGFPGESLLYGSYSDEIGGEYWAEGTLGDIENRIATSCGHIYNKPRIWAESYTAAGNTFGRDPAQIKQRGDRFFAEGINSSLLHLYITQPYEDKVPGVNAWFSTEFNRHNTWFTQLDQFTTYLKRVNYMLQQGLNVADVAYFTGEDAPKMTGITDPALPQGYQFDYINYDVIMNKMSVKDGLLTLAHGTKYRMLVLPKLETMRPELILKIKQLILDGAVVYGPPPMRSPSYKGFPEADKLVSETAKEIWGDMTGVKSKSSSYGKGMILVGMDMQKALDMIHCLPDCKTDAGVSEDKNRTDGGVKVHYGHRTLSNADIYFLTNQTNEELQFTATFRVAGTQPEWWEPTSGRMRNLKAYTQDKETTSVPLKLAPNESAFVVFRKKAGAVQSVGIEGNFPIPTLLTEVKGPWTVRFADELRGPKDAVVFEKLEDWSQNTNELIKYYSGTAFYHSTFSLDKLPEGQQIKVDLAELSSMARVSINGMSVGGVWTPPYVVDITNSVKEGENTIDIEVVNTWVNRLIGDLNLPAEKRTTSLTHNSWNATDPLKKSGLIGPVKIESVAE